MKKTKLMLGDNIESLKKLPDNSIDSVVTDPPYGLSLMNKKWDYEVPKIEFWIEVYRVLKPGGHVLSFGGTRTYHRMVVNIEDAGFEIRDQIQWIYGSGFPKSLNIGKAIDKLEGNEREVVGENPYNELRGETTEGIWKKGIETGFGGKSMIDKGESKGEGWGTNLKPANEPICVARKPLSEKTIVDNVIKWGTGGLNIDGCRIGYVDEKDKNSAKWGSDENPGSYFNGLKSRGLKNIFPNNEGRFPANLILDESAAEMLDEQSYVDKGGASRFFYQAKVSKAERNMGLDGFEVEILSSTIKLLLKTDYNNKNLLWEKQDLKTKLVDTDKSHQKDIEEFGVQKNEDKKWNTELFGKVFTDQFLMDTKSIILTATNSIMIYQTLNSLIQKNIKTNIQELNGLMVKDIKLVNDVENKNIKMTFILQNKDGYFQNVNLVELNEVWTLSVKENKCSHLTLKPINLMTYLCRLVTPANGIVLDPFMGSGSTGISALLEGFRFIGMEMDKDYFKIAEARINSYEEYRKLIK